MDPKQKPILFVQTAFLGDLCLSVPALKQIRNLYPERPLFLVTRAGLQDFFVQLGLVDQAWGVEKKNSKSYRAVAQALSQYDFEIIFSPHESLTTALFIRRLRATQKIGFKKWWNFIFFTHRTQKPNSLPDALRQLSLVSSISPDLQKKIDWSLNQNWFEAAKNLPAVPEWASAQALPLQPVRQKSLAIFPGSVWATKKWTDQGFTEVAQYFSEAGYKIILMGSKAEFEICEKIAAQNESCENRAGRDSLFESVQLLSQVRAVLSNDSGGQHLAALAAAPVLSLFGPTVRSQGFRPWSSLNGIAEVENLSCRPCGAHGHQKCPLGTHECMKSLSSQKVIQSLESLLSGL